MPRYTLHLAPKAEFEASDPSSDYAPAAFAREGFIHCTDGAEEMARTANRHYAGDPREFLVLVLDRERIAAPVTVEDERGIYPHIHGRLNRDAIVRIVPMPRSPDGRFLPPELGAP
ncbi:MAG: hypothetical protein KatS3mg060_3411 [Dehalococcoidia bacterium]|nr:MAG: hypothetical protein KatS3mg060_3411 [Dehalococcoidia bacterium]